MSQIVADAELARQLAAAEGPVNVLDEGGTLIGVCTPIKFPHSPYSREEIERSRQQCRETGGRPLSEFLATLKEQHP